MDLNDSMIEDDMDSCDNDEECHEIVELLLMSDDDEETLSSDYMVNNLESSKLCLTGRMPIPLYLSCNPDSLNPFQSEIRKHMEFFEATPIYLKQRRGRNKAIVLGQVGIQCRHCSSLRPNIRAKGAVYFSQRLIGIYQAAQILATTHLLDSCPLVPLELKEDLKQMKEDKTAKTTSGKEYWAHTAQALGVYEDEYGLRFEPHIPTYDVVKARNEENGTSR